MLWELYQMGRLRNAEMDASQALGSASRAADDISSMHRTITGLEQQVERLTLATIAMIEIMQSRHGVTPEEFEAKVREIDLRDGKLDGRLQQQVRPPRNCPACGRPNGGLRTACLYCGAMLPGDPMLTHP